MQAQAVLLSVAFFCEGERGGAYQSMLKCFSLITAPVQASREGGGIFHVLAEASLKAGHLSAQHPEQSKVPDEVTAETAACQPCSHRSPAGVLG